MLKSDNSEPDDVSEPIGHATISREGRDQQQTSYSQWKTAERSNRVEYNKNRRSQRNSSKVMKERKPKDDMFNLEYQQEVQDSYAFDVASDSEEYVYDDDLPTTSRYAKRNEERWWNIGNKRKKEQAGDDLPETLNISSKLSALSQQKRAKLRACTDLDTTAILQNFAKRGWKLVSSDSDWDFYWGSIFTLKNLFSVESGYRMRDSQTFNHFPNQYEISRKDFLHKNIKRYRKELERQGNPVAQKSEDGSYKYLDFLPSTYKVPIDYGLFCEEYRRNPRSMWIMKPCNKSQGVGIFLINNLSKLKEWSPKANPPRENYILSRYIDKPLLIGGKKFDLRLYVVVLSFKPLKAYLFRQGICRFCALKYNASAKHMNNKLVHLTNVSIQRHGHSYNEFHGGKWSLQNFYLYLESTRGVHVVDSLIESIRSMILHSLHAVKNAIISDRHCFELYGYDIIIDADFKPWLIEVNSAPSLTSTTYNDRILKLKLIEDLLNIVLPPNGRPNVRWNKVPRFEDLGDFELLVDEELTTRESRSSENLNMSVKNSNTRKGMTEKKASASSGISHPRTSANI